MIYSQSTVYALEALGYIASLPPRTIVNVRDIATKLKIPEHFLGKVLSQLVKKKFISSTKGPTGGFTLNADPEKVTIYRILASLDSLEGIEDDCVMGLQSCTPERPCPLHDNWVKFRDEAVPRIQKLTLAQLSENVMAKLSPGVGDESR